MLSNRLKLKKKGYNTSIAKDVVDVNISHSETSLAIQWNFLQKVSGETF